MYLSMDRYTELKYKWIETKYFGNGQVIVTTGHTEHYTMACFLTEKYYKYLF